MGATRRQAAKRRWKKLSDNLPKAIKKATARANAKGPRGQNRQARSYSNAIPWKFNTQQLKQLPPVPRPTATRSPRGGSPSPVRGSPTGMKRSFSPRRGIKRKGGIGKGRPRNYTNATWLPG